MRGAPGLQFRAFFRKSTVRQCNTAPGRRRERSGGRARAAPMGQGVGRVWRPPAPRVPRARLADPPTDRRRRASSARDSPTLPRARVFDRFGPDKGPSTVQKRFNMMERAVEGAPDCAPHPGPRGTRHMISCMRVRALHDIRLHPLHKPATTRVAG